MHVDICNHGFWLADCAMCAKLPGECDYGACEAPATTHVQTVAHGRVVESRPMCARHNRRDRAILEAINAHLHLGDTRII